MSLWWETTQMQRLPQWLSGKEATCNAGAAGGVDLVSGSEDPLEEDMATHSSTPGQRSLAGYSPWAHKVSGKAT